MTAVYTRFRAAFDDYSAAKVIRIKTVNPQRRQPPRQARKGNNQRIRKIYPPLQDLELDLRVKNVPPPKESYNIQQIVKRGKLANITTLL